MKKVKFAIDDQGKLIHYVQRCPKMNNFDENRFKRVCKRICKNSLFSY